MLKAGLVSLVLAYMLSQFYRPFWPCWPRCCRSGRRGPAIWPCHRGCGSSPSRCAAAGGGGAGPVRTAAARGVADGGGWGRRRGDLCDGRRAVAPASGDDRIGHRLLSALMGPYFIFAREYPPASFGMLAGVLVGFDRWATSWVPRPWSWVIEAAGWRQTMWGLAAVTLMWPRWSWRRCAIRRGWARGIRRLDRSDPAPARAVVHRAAVRRELCGDGGDPRIVGRPLAGAGAWCRRDPDRPRHAGDGPGHGRGQLCRRTRRAAWPAARAVRRCCFPR